MEHFSSQLSELIEELSWSTWSSCFPRAQKTEHIDRLFPQRRWRGAFSGHIEQWSAEAPGACAPRMQKPHLLCSFCSEIGTATHALFSVLRNRECICSTCSRQQLLMGSAPCTAIDQMLYMCSRKAAASCAPCTLLHVLRQIESSMCLKRSDSPCDLLPRFV